MGVVLGSFLLGRDLVAAVLFAALPGGIVAGLLSRESGHVGSGARAGAYGGIVAFLGFVAIGAVQTVLGGDLSVLFLGVQTVLVALLVVPIHAAVGGPRRRCRRQNTARDGSGDGAVAATAPRRRESAALATPVAGRGSSPGA
ncbi:hypothetical protein GJ631_07800 [Natronomonas sp. CBA1123]|uniref:hypothetical protein n=1 Tax=Natronomonas sp. CBA1123 TaxID=2668070 RepID=UPI0012EA0FA8|nr:hypothetical protein [Natronomonas sp. CBA1123]MUV86474.1 hypothetical protein [Natronomonas sp. CBA1123]